MSALATWAVLDHSERVARCRALAALVRVFAGRDAADLIRLLRAAEHDPDALAACDAAIQRLPTRTMRRMWATFAATLPMDGRR